MELLGRGVHTFKILIPITAKHFNQLMQLKGSVGVQWRELLTFRGNHSIRKLCIFSGKTDSIKLNNLWAFLKMTIWTSSPTKQVWRAEEDQLNLAVLPSSCPSSYQYMTHSTAVSLLGRLTRTRVARSEDLRVRRNLWDLISSHGLNHPNMTLVQNDFCLDGVSEHPYHGFPSAVRAAMWQRGRKVK